jgi:hypothetical protein
MSDQSWARHVWEQCVADYDAGLRKPTGALERMLKVMRETVEADIVERCAEVAERWSEHYPTKVFPPGGTSQDSQSAAMARHTCEMVAMRIRHLLQNDD